MGEPYIKTATLSRCGQYRYLLRRRWEAGGAVVFIMLNPSTADADNDDPTIRRCVGFARSWGFGAVEVVNLFAYRATDPDAMKAHDAPVGPENNMHIIDAITKAEVDRSPVVAAWGVHGSHRSRAVDVIDLPRDVPLMCLGTTKFGHPKHPLYVAGNQPLVEFRPGQRP